MSVYEPRLVKRFRRTQAELEDLDRALAEKRYLWSTRDGGNGPINIVVEQWFAGRCPAVAFVKQTRSKGA